MLATADLLKGELELQIYVKPVTPEVSQEKPLLPPIINLPNYWFIIVIIIQMLSTPGSEWVDPADPTVIAEQELLGAAASIDAAARKLDALRPRVAPKTQVRFRL